MTPPVQCGVVLTKLLSWVGVSQWHFARHSFATFPGEFNTLRCKAVLSCPHMITQCYSAQAKEMKEEVLWLWIFSRHFLLALGILGGKLWSTWDLKTWKHCHNYLLALYKNVTCYSSSLRLFVYISTLALWAILKEVFALIRFEKYLKPPLLFLLFLPLTCAWKRKKKKEKERNVPPI